MYTVTSEIYAETDFQSKRCTDGKIISRFKFQYPEDTEEYFNHEHDINTKSLRVDEDGDLLLERRKRKSNDIYGIIEVEHLDATNINLVGLQVWRGALLLADYCFYKRREFSGKYILELGAGVGLTSIVAAIYIENVVCTDIDKDGILQQIHANVKRNRSLHCKSHHITILKYDFMTSPQNYTHELLEVIDKCDIVLAADVIYDNNITLAFIRVIDTIFSRGCVTGRKKSIYLALEKRYVFTKIDLDSVAPMFDYFLTKTMDKPWHFEYIEIDFPQYFDYERSHHLVLICITSK